MQSSLDEKSIIDELIRLNKDNLQVLWVAIDVTVRFQGNGRESLDEILRLPRTKGTTLPEALHDFHMEQGIVVTDDDGYNQIRNQGNMPLAIGLVSGAKLRWIIKCKEPLI